MRNALPLSRNWFIPFVCLWVTVYFFYHGIEGNHGIKKLSEIKSEMLIASQILDKATQEKNLLQSKVNALSSKSLDIDQLEESALRILNMGNANVRVILKWLIHLF